MSKAKDLLAARQAKFDNTPNTTPTKDELKVYSGPLNNFGQSFYDYTSNIQDSPEFAIRQSPFSNDFFTAKLLGFNLGEVDETAYNRRDVIDPFNPKIDFMKIRADRQSAISKVGSGVANFLGDTTIGIAGNIVGGFYGLGSAIAQGDINQIFDNSVYRSLDDAKESWEAKNTLFVNSNDNFGFNAKTGKELTDAFSFIASAIASEAIMQTAGNTVGGAGILSAGGRFSRYMNQLGKLFKVADKFQDYEKLGMQLGKTVEEMSAIRNTIEKIKATTELGRRILTTTSYEAGLEARGAKDEFLSNMQEKLEYILENDNTMSDAEKDKYRADFTKRMNEDAEKVGMTTFLANTAMLSVSNAAQFPTVFGSSYLKKSLTSDLTRKGIDNIARNKSIISGVGRILKNPTVEFLEETGQGLAGQTSQNYYEIMLGDKTQAGVLSPTAHNFGASLWKGLEDTYGTSEGLHEGLIGAVVGAIGIPGFKKRSGKGYKIQMQGGIAESLKEIRQQKQYTEAAINHLNSQKLSEVLSYNKDNAIRAGVDAKREDLANINKDPIELEDVENNKVFRYTIDRMSKGAEEFIDQDIQDLRNMDLDKYKQVFDKSDTFSEEEKQEEIDAFKEKSDIYKQAYKAVNKRFVSRLLNTDPVHSKLTDVLTYAVASEKLYGDRLNNIKKRIIDLNLDNITSEEINKFTETSRKVKLARNKLNKYIDSRVQVKEFNEQQKIKNNLEDKYRYLLDLDSAILQEQLENTPKEDELYTNLEKAINLKEQYDNINLTFDAKKSKTARELQKIEEAKIEELNKAIEDSYSKSIKLIRKPKNSDKLTKKELDDYLQFRKDVEKAINNKNKTSGVLDIIENDPETNLDLMSELEEISNKYTLSAEIASYLYGFKDNPYSAYGKILASELQANIENALNQKVQLEFSLMFGQDINSEESKLLLDELNASQEIIKEGFENLKPGLNKEAVIEIEKIIKDIDEFLSIYKTVQKQKQEKQEQKKKAAEKQTEEATQQEIEDMIRNSGLVVEESTEDFEEKAPEKRTAIAYKKKTNRLSIRQAADINSVNPKMQEFSKLLDEGKIKSNSATTLNLINNEVDLKNNEYLQNKLKELNLYDKYISGMNKVINNPEILNNKDYSDFDSEVATFIRFAPIEMNIYDNKVEDNDFDVNTLSDPTYTQYLFEGEDLSTINDNALEKEFQNKKLVLEKQRDKDLEESTSDIDKQFIINKFKEDIDILKESLESSKNTQFTVFDFRRNVLKQNYLNNNNIFKLKVFNVDNGDIESSEFGKKQIVERNLEELINKSDLTPDHFYYTDQNRNYRALTGDLIRSGHPLFNKKAKDNGKLFLLYEDIAGRKIPIKLNSRLLEKELANTIYNQLEEYFSSTDSEAKTVTNSGIKFLDNENLKTSEFIYRFIRRKSNNVDQPILLKDAFALNNRGFFLYIGETEGIHIKNLEDLKNNKELLINKLSQVRMFPNKYMLLDEENKINKAGLDYLIDNKLLNHTFDIENNFDKIYSPGYRKGIVISKVNTDTDQPRITRSKSYGSKLKELSNIFNSKYSRQKGFEANTKSVYLSIRNGVLNSFRKLQQSDNYKDKTDEEILEQAIENIFNSRLESIKEVMDAHPDKTRENDPLTKLLDLVNNIKENSFTNKLSKNNLLKESKLWGSKTLLINEFKNPSRFIKPIAFTDKSAVAVTNLMNEEQFTSLMTIVTKLKQLVDDSYLGYVDIKYTDAYRYKNAKRDNKIIEASSPYQYTDLSGVSKDLIESKHVKSRLRDVKIIGNPRIDPETRKITGGSVVFQMETRNKDGEYNQVPVTVISDQSKPHDNTNIMTSLYLPFIDKNGILDEDALEQAFQDVKVRENIRLKGMSADLKKVDKIEINEEETLPEARPGEGAISLISRALKQAQEDNKQEKPKSGFAKMVAEKEMSAQEYEREILSQATNLIEEEKPLFNTIKFQNSAIRENITKSINDFVNLPQVKEIVKNNINRQGIENADQLYQVLSVYESKHNTVFSEDIKTISENLFDQKIEDCNG